MDNHKRIVEIFATIHQDVEVLLGIITKEELVGLRLELDP